MCIGLAHCKEEDGTLEKACDRYCGGLWATDAGGIYCDENCVEMMDDALAISEGCGAKYRLLIQCLGDNPAEIDAWETWRNTDKTDYPCSEQTVKFKDDCPNLWFLDPEFQEP